MCKYILIKDIETLPVTSSLINTPNPGPLSRTKPCYKIHVHAPDSYIYRDICWSFSLLSRIQTL